MKAHDKPQYVKICKELYDSLDIDYLIANPNDLKEIKKINKLIAILASFSSDVGSRLDELFKDFQRWARQSTRITHIRNRAIDMMQFIDKSIQNMDINEIKDGKKFIHTDQKDKFDVALSFAGEQRTYVEKVALYIEQQGNISVFYDTNREVEMWGNNLVDYLKDVFQTKANYCVMFISKEYTEKIWPNFERQIIQARALIDKGYILPVRFDNTPLDGEIPTTKYLTVIDLSPEKLGEMIIKKVIGGDKYETKKDSNVITISNNTQITTSEEIPMLYIKPSIVTTGGPSGHFLNFFVKNMTGQVLLDIKWGIRGFGYEWKQGDAFFELEPNEEKELAFPLSEERIFTEHISELNIFAEYKDLNGQCYFVRRTLEQELVPSGAFYNFKAASFHSPALLKDDGLEFLAGPISVGDADEAIFSIPTNKGKIKVKIAISRSLSSIWGFTNNQELRQALLELGHRKIRRMVQENNIKDYLFTTYDYPEGAQAGREGYISLRDSI